MGRLLSGAADPRPTSPAGRRLAGVGHQRPLEVVVQFA
jgi:hypothetical protein